MVDKAEVERRLKLNPDFYRNMGKKGGSKTGVKKGFAARPELASEMGAKGGKLSSRKGIKNKKHGKD